MKAKNLSKSEVFRLTPLRRKPRPQKDPFSKKPEFIISFGNDAETIRKEVIRVKEKLKKRPSFFERLGDNDLLKLKKD